MSGERLFGENISGQVENGGLAEIVFGKTNHGLCDANKFGLFLPGERRIAVIPVVKFRIFITIICLTKSEDESAEIIALEAVFPERLPDGEGNMAAGGLNFHRGILLNECLKVLQIRGRILFID